MYPSDLSDAQWSGVESLLSLRHPGRHAGERPRKYALREVVNALLYVVKTGCQWRQLRGELSALAVGSPAVPGMARRWCRGRAAAAAAYRRRAKWLAERGDHRCTDREDGAKRGQRGYDAGKRTKGRKRHIAVDTEDNLLACVVHSAGIQDRVGARAVLMRLFCRIETIATVYADGGYTGKLVGWAKEMFGYRSFAWMNWSRRLSKDFELNPKSSETMIHIANVHRLLRKRSLVFRQILKEKIPWSPSKMLPM